MTKLCRALLKYENKIKLVEKIMHNFVVHSNESPCIKVDVLGCTKSITLITKSLVTNFETFYGTLCGGRFDG